MKIIKTEFKKGDKVFFCRPDLNDFTAHRGVIDYVKGENAFIENIDVAIPIDCLDSIIEEIIDIQPLKKNYVLAYLIDPDYLDSLGYRVIKFDGQCGIAKEKKYGGKKQLQYNLEGISCDYVGNKLPMNIAFGVKDDWNSRTTFNGFIRNKEDLNLILQLTR